MYTTRATLTYALGFGAIFLGVVAVPAGVVSPHSGTTWFVIAYLALGTTLLGQFLYLSGLRRISPGRASLIATLEPVVAACLGYVVLGEGLDLWQVLGGLLVLSAVVIAGFAQTEVAEKRAG